MKPRIGLNCDIEELNRIGESGRTRSRVWDSYHRLISQHGGTPLMIPPDVAPAEVGSMLDGVLLIGGDDYYAALPYEGDLPSRFLAVHPDREKADLQWSRFLISSDLPVLGICGGFQVLALEAGGRLFGDLEDETGSTLIHRRKEVDVGPLPDHPIRWHGGLDRTPAEGSFQVNSSHHQAVAQLPPGWKLLADAADGIIESAVDDSGRMVGVQWHPELIPDEPISRAITCRFIEWSRQQMKERD
ncbi:MAG: gamma-glutamyl-gamma-aminobutyrate hydrolase family protein [Planctomycetota bacterium]|nr:gamma-glutamyl-gamma-aminobutyrate hydrolase family protein [Planctomycetota bacterium]